MSKFILQVTFDNSIQDILLKTQDYCYQFSDRDHDYANKKLLTSLTLGYNSDQLVVQKPISQREEVIRNIAIITLQHIFQIPLVFEDRGEASSVEQMYAQYIKTDLPADKELHIVAYMSLCNKEDIACLEKFINSFPRNLTITVDVVLLPVSLKKKLTDAAKQALKTNLQRLISIKESHSECFGNIFYSQSIDAIGATHDFDLNEQIKIYGAIILSLINGYDCVSSQATDYPITVIGLSSVGIDKFAIVNNWAQSFIRGLISPLIETESTSYTVDVNKVHQVLSDILKEEKEIQLPFTSELFDSTATLFFGKGITEAPMKMSESFNEGDEVTLWGEVFKTDERSSRDGNTFIYTAYFSDKTSSEIIKIITPFKT